VLVASEGREISAKALEFAAQLGSKAKIHVLSIARVWGTSFGFPHPGLLPSRNEWAEQRSIVASAIERLKSFGVDASGQVLAARSPAKHIIKEATRCGCDAIVMTADPRRHWLVSDFLWSQEPYRVQSRAPMPVYLIVGSAKVE
jgi:nucleotide-binding universal stress UspA family protein